MYRRQSPPLDCPLLLPQWQLELLVVSAVLPEAEIDWPGLPQPGIELHWPAPDFTSLLLSRIYSSISTNS